MEDQLIEFSTAQLAKEKGFHTIKCNNSFTLEGYECDKPAYNLDGDKHLIARPTQSLLQRWLWKVHNIHVYCLANFYNNNKLLGYIYSIDKFDKDNNYLESFDEELFDKIGIEIVFKTYEQALETGLQEALKLI